MTQKKRLLKRNNPPGISIDKLISSSSKDARLIETKHQKIIEGACSVLFEKGYHETTIREIAKACKMSMGQLYHYISSKDDILYLVHKHMHKVVFGHLKKSGVEEIIDPLQRLEKVLYHTLEFMVENKKLFQFVYTESKHLDKKHLRAVLEMDDKNVVGFYRQLLKEINQNILIKADINFAANLITYLLVFLPLRGWNLKDRPTNKNMASLREFILRGIGLIQ
jgi:AcrR family transcriptional regulator